MTSTGAPAGGDQDRGSSLTAIFWVESGIACIVVSLRICARVMIRKVGVDDYMMLLTLVCELWFHHVVRYVISLTLLASFPYPRLLYDISCEHWRVSSPIFSKPTATITRCQVQLDFADMGHLRLCDGENLRRTTDSANYWS